MAGQDLVLDSRGAFKKAAQVVMARERGDLDLADRKLFNHLLWRANRNLKDRPVHCIPVKDALDYLGHRSPARVHESLRRLGQVKIEIDYKDENGDDRMIGAHYLSYDVSRTEDGMLYFAFDPVLLRFLHEPKVFAVLHDGLNQRFRSRYAAKLYEVMAMHEKRFSPVWEVTPDALRVHLNIPDGQHERADNLRSKVVEKAIAEVNEIAPFDVGVDYVRGRGGKIVLFRFRPLPKTLLTPPPSVADPVGRGARGRRDPNTPDILDGMTDAERGGPPRLSRETVRRAIEMIGPDDGYAAYEEEWLDQVRMHRIPDPDRAFLDWLTVRLAAKKDEALLDVDADTWGLLLEQME